LKKDEQALENKTRTRDAKEAHSWYSVELVDEDYVVLGGYQRYTFEEANGF